MSSTKCSFELTVENADGPFQLILMDTKLGVGRRILGSKGSPFKKIIKKWVLSTDDLETLHKEIGDMIKKHKEKEIDENTNK